MTVHLRSARFGVLAFALGVGGVLGLLIVPAMATSRPECEVAWDWVQSQKGRLPATLREISAFPRSYRLQIFNALPKEAKASLWRERYAQLLTRPLTPAQRELVHEAIPMITPALYAVPGQGRMAADWSARAKVAFPRGNGLGWISDLADTPGSYDVLPAALRPARLETGASSTAALLPECTCAVSEDNDLCPPQGLKCCGFNNCDTPIFVGCGQSGLNFCDGLCRNPTHPDCTPPRK